MFSLNNNNNNNNNVRIISAIVLYDVANDDRTILKVTGTNLKISSYIEP